MPILGHCWLVADLCLILAIAFWFRRCFTRLPRTQKFGCLRQRSQSCHRLSLKPGVVDLNSCMAACFAHCREFCISFIFSLSSFTFFFPPVLLQHKLAFGLNSESYNHLRDDDLCFALTVARLTDGNTRMVSHVTDGNIRSAEAVHKLSYSTLPSRWALSVVNVWIPTQSQAWLHVSRRKMKPWNGGRSLLLCCEWLTCRNASRTESRRVVQSLRSQVFHEQICNWPLWVVSKID